MDETDRPKDRASRTRRPAHRARTVPGKRKRANDVRLVWSALDAVQLSVYGITPEGRFLYVNDSACASLGYTRDELLRMTVADVDPDCPADARQAHWDRLKNHRTLDFESRHRRKDGTTFPVEIAGSYVEYEGQELEFALVRDVTERHSAQRRQEHLYRALRAVPNVNQVITHERERGTLLDRVCRTLVETRGYPYAWVALVDATGAVTEFRESEQGPDEHVAVRMAPQEGRLRACGERALAESRIVVTRDPATECLGCPNAGAHERHGSLTAPLMHDGRAMGVLAVSVSTEFLDDEEEQRLLVEIAGDIAFALQALEQEEARLRAEEPLAKSERRYRELFEQSRDAIFLVAPAGRVLEVNQACLDLFGFSLGELPGLNIVDMYANPEEREDFLRRIAETGFLADEVRFRKSDGTVLDCERTVVVRKDEHGNTVAYQALVRDVTERKQAEEVLRESEERYRAVFENSGTAMATIEEDTTISLVNHQFEVLSGYSREEVEGKKRWTEFVAAGDLERMKRHHGARRAGEPAPNEYVFRFIDRQGNVKFTHLNVGLVPGTMKSISSLRDITEERKAQDRLQESFIDLVETMARAMESLDPYTSGHQRRVARLADLVGRELGMSDDRLQGLYVGALLHDIGKLSVPSTILTKPGSLTKQEWNVIRAHPRRGYDILKEANLPWLVAEMALRHHERLDGSGYPDGTKGAEFNLEVRILGVCDVVEAMSSDRPYRAARPAQEVIQELRTGSGQRYDPQVVEAALKVVEGGAFPLWVNGVDTDGDEPEEEKRPSYMGPVAGEGATVVERRVEIGGRAPSGGNRPEEQPREELLNLAETLSRAMASRDPSTTNHQRRVADFVVQVSTRLGLPAERMWGLRLGGLLHDVGKIAVPELILTRPGRLSDEELELVRMHPEAGYEILRVAGLPPIVPLLALHHHELLDGSGYPRGLSGDALTMEDRILSVCNIVEAMGAHRPYRRGLEKREVIAEIVTGRGARYEPTVVDCVLGLLESGEFVLGE